MRTIEEIQKDIDNPIMSFEEKDTFIKEKEFVEFHIKNGNIPIQNLEKLSIEQPIDVKKEKQEIIPLTKDQQIVVNDFYAKTDFNEQKDFLDVLIKSKQLPEHIKSVETAFTIAQAAKELKVPLMQGLANIIPIKGKLTLTAKLSAAILKREEGKIRYRTIKDGMYVYNINGEIKESEYPLYGGGTKEHSDYFMCRITSIEIKRFYEPNNFAPQGEIITEIVSYSTIDATRAELIDKDNWKKMPRAMLYARCMNEMSTRVAPDLVLGMGITEVYADSSKITIKLDEEGNYQSL